MLNRLAHQGPGAYSGASLVKSASSTLESKEGETSSEAKSSLEAVYGSSLESSVSLGAECIGSWNWTGAKLCSLAECGKRAEMRVSCQDKCCLGWGWKYFCRLHLRAWTCTVCSDEGWSEEASVEEEEVITQFLRQPLVDSGAYITVIPSRNSASSEQST